LCGFDEIVVALVLARGAAGLFVAGPDGRLGVRVNHHHANVADRVTLIDVLRRFIGLIAGDSGCLLGRHHEPFFMLRGRDIDDEVGLFGRRYDHVFRPSIETIGDDIERDIVMRFAALDVHGLVGVEARCLRDDRLRRGRGGVGLSWRCRWRRCWRRCLLRERRSEDKDRKGKGSEFHRAFDMEAPHSRQKLEPASPRRPHDGHAVLG